MRVLVVDGYSDDDPNRDVVVAATAALRSRGAEIDCISLAGDEFATFMTADERTAYETATPLLADATKASAELVQQADALLFCYPTTMFGVPPRLKSWLERVMVMGVAFDFDDKQRVRPALTNIKHLGVVTTSPHSVARTARARDLGRRTFMRTLRLNCHPRCARTFVRLGPRSPHSQRYLQTRLVRWR